MTRPTILVFGIRGHGHDELTSAMAIAMPDLTIQQGAAIEMLDLYNSLQDLKRAFSNTHPAVSIMCLQYRRPSEDLHRELARVFSGRAPVILAITGAVFEDAEFEDWMNEVRGLQESDVTKVVPVRVKEQCIGHGYVLPPRGIADLVNEIRRAMTIEGTGRTLSEQERLEDDFIGQYRPLPIAQEPVPGGLRPLRAASHGGGIMCCDDDRCCCWPC